MPGREIARKFGWSLGAVLMLMMLKGVVSGESSVGRGQVTSSIQIIAPVLRGNWGPALDPTVVGTVQRIGRLVAKASHQWYFSVCGVSPGSTHPGHMITTAMTLSNVGVIS